MVNISIEVILSIPFFIFSNAIVQFVEKELTWKSYTTAEALSTTKRVEFIYKKEFAKMTLDENSETFVVHIVFPNLIPGIYQHKEAQIAFLLIKKVKILDKYLDFANVFLEKKALVLPKRTKLNKYTINLENGKQVFYGPI